jgi:hypothetical protein
VTKKRPASKTESDEADPRFIPIAEAFASTPGFSLMESKSRATRGLRLHGKSFGMSSHGRFILKLTEERVAALVADGVGVPFRAAAGRIMKGWIEVTSPKAKWLPLAKEALRIAADDRARAPASKRTSR